MADDAATTDEAPITFNVKSSSDAKYVLTVPLSLTVLDLKQKLAGSEYADIPPERQRLIYSGRVLKDPDTLASYKVKEGNTIHLVKGAASNQRQNPANQGTSTTSGTGSTPAAAGVPNNIAAGTGNNPLAGLTGARYAGFAQLPGAGMFGPDGGMGPPPDPEHMINMLQDPSFASTLDEALQNPALIDQMIANNPMLRGMGPQVRQAMQNPAIRRMMTDPEMMRQASQMQRQMGGGMFGGAGQGDQPFPMPGATDTTPGQGQEGQRTEAQATQAQANPFADPFAMFGNPAAAAGGAGAGAGAVNPFAALFQPPSTATGNTNLNPTSPPPAGQESTTTSTDTNTENQQQQQQTPQPQNPFAAAAQNPMFQSILQNPQLMQQMMQSFFGGSPSATNPSDPNSTPQQPGNPFASLFGPAGLGAFGAAPPQQQPQDTRPPEVRYEDQLRQLNDMGFYEFERNVEALRRAGGSVQGAVEYLLQGGS